MPLVEESIMVKHTEQGTSQPVVTRRLFLGIALGAATDAPGLVVLGILASVVLGIWLYVRFALCVPALMLETQAHGNGPPAPIGIVEALRRSSRLVSRSWWRTFGILLLVFIVVVIVSYAIGIPFSLPATLGDGDMFTMAGMSFGALVVSTIGEIISVTITAPFSAGATVLLYIDRRIRREALDIELARAANVDLPGRTEGPGYFPGQAPGYGPGQGPGYGPGYGGPGQGPGYGPGHDPGYEGLPPGPR
jgi:hypothetical protein